MKHPLWAAMCTRICVATAVMLAAASSAQAQPAAATADAVHSQQAMPPMQTLTLSTPNPEPAIAVRFLRRSGPQGVLYPDLRLSQSMQDSLCWDARAGNQARTNKVEVVEYFSAPAPTSFGGEGALSSHNADRTEHRVISQIQPDENGHISRCWRFDHTDPPGPYTIRVELNRQPAVQQTFQLLP